MKRLLFFSVMLTVITVRTPLFSQQMYQNATLDERRAAIFSASRSKMFNPSDNWSTARTTINQRGGSSDEGGSKMIDMLSESSDGFKKSRSGGLGMFITVGNQLQGLIPLAEEGTEEIVDALSGGKIASLEQTGNVTEDKAVAVDRTTGIYAPRIRVPHITSEEILLASRKSLISREAELNLHLNEKFRIPEGPPLELSINNGIAVLRGTVDNVNKRKVAEIFVSLEPGIVKIHNELKVEDLP
ncbi:MAG: BON domain-containing protein [Planctomycetaceae bacterium]|jgi:hypothetical protein|nr:BON domain-containing protein [Planctomycetaceae bacterium]